MNAKISGYNFKEKQYLYGFKECPPKYLFITVVVLTCSQILYILLPLGDGAY